MAAYDTNAIESGVQERLIKALSACLPDEGMGLILITSDRTCHTRGGLGSDQV